MNKEILNKIKQCDTIPKLDELRLEATKAMVADNGANFYEIQKAFIKQQNKLKRIPLKDRSW